MRRAAVAVMMLTGLLIQAQPATACTCAVRSIAEQIDAASTIFTGEVATIRTAATGMLSVTFNVSILYKGEVSRRALVTTAKDGAACGIPFAPEKTYVVFAAPFQGTLTTGVCSGTTDDASVVAGLTPIDTFAPPVDGDLPGDEPGSRSLPIGTAAGLLALVVAVSIWSWLVRIRPPRPLV